MGRPLHDEDVVERGGRAVSRAWDRPVVRCMLCERVWTESVGTKLCDPCWELRHRIIENPELAIKVLREGAGA